MNFDHPHIPFFCEIYCELFEKPSQKMGAWFELAFRVQCKYVRSICPVKTPTCVLVFVLPLGRLKFPHANQNRISHKRQIIRTGHCFRKNGPGSPASQGSLDEGCQSSIVKPFDCYDLPRELCGILESPRLGNIECNRVANIYQANCSHFERWSAKLNIGGAQCHDTKGRLPTRRKGWTFAVKLNIGSQWFCRIEI